MMMNDHLSLFVTRLLPSLVTSPSARAIMPTYLGIEGGGTTWKVAIAKDRPDNIVEYERFDTTGDPMDTLLKIKVSSSSSNSGIEKSLPMALCHHHHHHNHHHNHHHSSFMMDNRHGLRTRSMMRWEWHHLALWIPSSPLPPMGTSLLLPSQDGR